MTACGDDVARPARASDYRLKFATREAEKGWRDLCATARNAAVDAWEFLTATPRDFDPDRCYPLKGDLATVTIEGRPFTRLQYKPTSGGRIWYAVEPPVKGSKQRGIVWLERVATGHPNETLKNYR